jgi:alpha-amylase/alpha-mannosidase (GH57 family)
MERLICIHAHFYQPPRDNPWLGEVEAQESAKPYHDWNERITAECYSPNAGSPILDPRGDVVQSVNNYSKISFNFGPTLLSWMERHHPEVYGAIIQADEESRNNFSGHGSAIAQVYNHMIMPLADRKDKQTQVRWGIVDFESRFGRHPEGMWLPETALDLESLEILAENSIKFTILDPRQAGRVRRIGQEKWGGDEGGAIDTRQAYLCNLPSGRSISIFFYDGPISHDIAFGGLLDNGETFARRMLEGFAQEERTQLVSVATDGETYGHHHRFGDMALAYCLNHIESNELARLTNYGEYLEMAPPEFEVKVLDNTSWSCAHGIERWRSNCGCALQQQPKLSQEWRGPLRNALNWLKGSVDDIFEIKGSVYFFNPWKARDEYVHLILDQRKDVVDRFLAGHLRAGISKDGKVSVLDLMEMERYAMLMFNSCGWFWDEISRIETAQIMRYAARAIQLAYQSSGIDLEPEFLRLIEAAPSNDPQLKNGAGVYQVLVRSAVPQLAGRSPTRAV